MEKIKRLLKFIKISNFDFNRNEPTVSKILYYILLNKIYKKIAIIFYKIFFTENKIFKDIYQFENLLKKFYSSNNKLVEDGIKYNLKDYNNIKSSNSEIKKIYTDGYIEITQDLNLSNDFINSFKEKLKLLKAYNSHVPLSSSLQKKSISESYSYFSFDPSEPSLKEFYKKILNNDKIKSVVSDYLGNEAKLYSINTMVTTKSKNFHQVTNLHRDFDDDKFLTLFVYWTDTSKNNGATYYIPGSHLKNSENINEGIYLEGKAGSCFFLNTFGLHAGNKNIVDRRIVTWFRFGKRTNLVHYVDKGYLHDSVYDEIY